MKVPPEASRRPKPRSESAKAPARTIFFLAAIFPAALAGGEAFPPGATVHGKNPGEWVVEWARWAFSYPRDRSPLLDQGGERCGTGQTGEVFFLAGHPHESADLFFEVRRDCKAPADREIFFPIFYQFHAGSMDGAEPCEPSCPEAKNVMDRISLLRCSIDGKTVRDLQSRRSSSACFKIALPANNVEGLPQGTYGNACCDGYWVMLKPLARGPHHIEIEGVLGNLESPEFEVRITYLISAEESMFMRGDVDANGRVEINDPILVLNWLFLGGEEPLCQDAADAEDSGDASIGDAIYLLNYLFLSGDPPEDPGPAACGRDSTADLSPFCPDSPVCQPAGVR